MYKTIRPYIFKHSPDPETAHEKVLHLLEWADHHPSVVELLSYAFKMRDHRLEKKLLGMTFPHPIGLAAGFSKDGFGARSLATIFGFLELGTVTPDGQSGNPRQRMFRLLEDKGLINRMGFNNLGAISLAGKRQEQGTLSVPVGLSIGKGKDTPLEQAHEDYEKCLKILYPYGDYFAINVSSPNTKDLRRLQNKEQLRHTLRVITVTMQQLAVRRQGPKKPIFVKVAPDLSFGQLDDVLEICYEFKIAGLIASNTTLSREGLTDPLRSEQGGYSGPLLFERSAAFVTHIRRQVPSFAIIASGGISHDYHVRQMLDYAGADLVQIFTGLIYEGPFVVRTILKRLLQIAEAKQAFNPQTLAYRQ